MNQSPSLEKEIFYALILLIYEMQRKEGSIVKWLAKTGHKIGKNKLSFTPINKKVEGKQNGTQKAQRGIQG